MLSNLLDNETQDKITETLGSVIFPLKCYLLLLLLILIMIFYYVFQLHNKF